MLLEENLLYVQEIIKIEVKDYLHTIEFSDEAREINRKLYGEQRD